MRKILLIALLFICSNLTAQDAIEYQTPPKEIYDLVMAKPTPGVSFDSKGQYMLILHCRLAYQPKQFWPQPKRLYYQHHH